MFEDVGAAAEFAEGVPRIVTAAGREIGVIRDGDEVFALRNVCPHQYAPVCRGHAMPLLVDDPDEGLAADDGVLVLVCPWHGWEFEVRTGRVVCGDAAYRLKTYPAKIDGDRVLVDAGGRATPSAGSAPRRRP